VDWYETVFISVLENFIQLFKSDHDSVHDMCTFDQMIEKWRDDLTVIDKYAFPPLLDGRTFLSDQFFKGTREFHIGNHTSVFLLL